MVKTKIYVAPKLQIEGKDTRQNGFLKYNDVAKFKYFFLPVVSVAKEMDQNHWRIAEVSIS